MPACLAAIGKPAQAHAGTCARGHARVQTCVCENSRSRTTLLCCCRLRMLPVHVPLLVSVRKLILGVHGRAWGRARVRALVRARGRVWGAWRSWKSSVFGFAMTTAVVPSSGMRSFEKQSSVEQSANVSASVKPICENQSVAAATAIWKKGG
eukprot:502575-Pleurochrysis_carterae.AAC.1